MRGTELVTYLQLESEERYERASLLDANYVTLSGHYDVMESVSAASAVLVALDGAVDPAVPSSTDALISRLQNGAGRSIDIGTAFGHRGVALLTNDRRVAITMGVHGVIESDGEDTGLVMERKRDRYISAFLIPGVKYPLSLHRAPVVTPKWPTTSVEGDVEEL